MESVMPISSTCFIPNPFSGLNSSDEEDYETSHLIPSERVMYLYSKLDKNYDDIKTVIQKIKALEAKIKLQESATSEKPSNTAKVLHIAKINETKNILEGLIMHRDQLGNCRVSLHRKTDLAETDAQKLSSHRRNQKRKGYKRKEKTRWNDILGIRLDNDSTATPNIEQTEKAEADGASETSVEIIT